MLRWLNTSWILPAGLVIVAWAGCTRPPAVDSAPALAGDPTPAAGGPVAAQGGALPQAASAEKPAEPGSVGQQAPQDALAKLPGRGEVRIGDADTPVLRVELARTAEERAQGLMYRRHLADDAGMVFDMESTGEWSFWMKNTLIPLDIIFIDAQWRVVCVVANATPETLQSRGCGKPSRWVLELSAGNAARYGIAEATPLRWRPLPDAPAARTTP